MYPSVESPSRLSDHNRKLLNHTLKFFILTPSVNFVNPRFSSILNRSRPFDDIVLYLEKSLLSTAKLDGCITLRSTLSPHDLDTRGLVSRTGCSFNTKQLVPTVAGSVSDLTTTSVASPPPSSTSTKTPQMGKTFDSSLGQLTKRFVDLLKASPDQVIDLNHAVSKLKIQKRRIYDITNVLEGVGLIVKVGNNNVAWNADSMAAGLAPSVAQMPGVVDYRPTLEDEKEEEKLDHYLSIVKSRAGEFPQERHPSHASSEETGGPDSRLHMYVPYGSITRNPAFGNDTVIGLRAPVGTTVQVPDPAQASTDGIPKYQVYVSTHTETGDVETKKDDAESKPIDVYLIRPQVSTGETEVGRKAATPSRDTLQRTDDQPYGCKPSVASPQPYAAMSVERGSSKRKASMASVTPHGMYPPRFVHEEDDDFEPQPAFRQTPSPQQHQPMAQYWGPGSIPAWNQPRQPVQVYPHSFPTAIPDKQQSPCKRQKTATSSIAMNTSPDRASILNQSSGAVSAASPGDGLRDIFASPLRGTRGGSADWQSSWNTPGRSGTSSIIGSSGSFGAPNSSSDESPNLMRSEIYDINMSPQSRDFVPAVYVASPSRTHDAEFSLPGIHVRGNELPTMRSSSSMTSGDISNNADGQPGVGDGKSA